MTLPKIKALRIGRIRRPCGESISLLSCSIIFSSYWAAVAARWLNFAVLRGVHRADHQTCNKSGAGQWMDRSCMPSAWHLSGKVPRGGMTGFPHRAAFTYDATCFGRKCFVCRW